ncbi:hypothetical protein [Pedobacter heparinus]|uniref:hypothetical protein n=1 Tax=Pedobacter heparinus TaxID=984 RepID=UPI0029308458|nr:hypothetical protein [Pedobacter heparinus]
MAFSQRVTYSDLKYILSSTIEETETYVLKKGFSYAGVNDYSNATSYEFSKNSKHSINYMSVSKYVCEDFTFQAYFFSVLQSDYTALKAYIKSIGYKLKSTERDGQATIFTYRKGNLDMEFTAAMSSLKEPIYSVVLIDNELAKKRWSLNKSSAKD